MQATPGTIDRFLGFLRAHPILCLALLTPGLPEYLSTSSPLLYLVENPFFFVFQLAVNVGQYTSGALLVREAALRWRKGWATVFLLGAAYAVTEEGLGDNTLFHSSQGADGVLGWFGRYGGVNWVWSTGVIAYHVIYSIGLPILLLGLALPATRGRSLVGARGIAVAFAALVASTATETALVYGEFHFWMGTGLLVGALVVIALLVALAYRVPGDLLRPGSDRPTGSTRSFFAIGFLFFPVAFVFEYGFTGTSVPPALLIGGELVVFALLFDRVRRGLGRSGNEPWSVALAFGFVLWLAVFGLVLHLTLPYSLPLAVLAVVFCLRLRKAYPVAPASPPR